MPRGPRELRHIMSVSSQFPLPPSLRGQHPISCPRRPYREETLTSVPWASISASSLNRAAKTRPSLTKEMTSWGPGYSFCLLTGRSWRSLRLAVRLTKVVQRTRKGNKETGVHGLKRRRLRSLSPAPEKKWGKGKSNDFPTPHHQVHQLIITSLQLRMVHMDSQKLCLKQLIQSPSRVGICLCHAGVIFFSSRNIPQ